VRHWRRDDWSIKDIVKHGYGDLLRFKDWNDQYNRFKDSMNEGYLEKEDDIVVYYNDEYIGNEGGNDMIYYSGEDGIVRKFKNASEMKEYLKSVPLQEKAILKNQQYNFSLHVTDDTDRYSGVGGAYFKWVNNESFSKADKIARIKFDETKYVTHRNEGGKENTTLSSKQKKQLVTLLSSSITSSNSLRILGGNDVLPIKYVEFMDYIDNGWKLLIFNHNKINGISEDIMYECIFKGRVIPKMMVPFTLPMPNYNELKK